MFVYLRETLISSAAVAVVPSSPLADCLIVSRSSINLAAITLPPSTSSPPNTQHSSIIAHLSAAEEPIPPAASQYVFIINEPPSQSSISLFFSSRPLEVAELLTAAVCDAAAAAPNQVFVVDVGDLLLDRLQRGIFSRLLPRRCSLYVFSRWLLAT